MMKTKKSSKADLENKKSTFFLIGLVLALGFVLFAFEWKSPVKQSVLVAGNTGFDTPEDLVIPLTKPEEPKQEKPITQVPIFKIVDDEELITDELLWEGDEPDEPVLIDFNNLVQPGNDKAEENLDKVFDRVQFMPEFPGGDKALLSYLSRNVKYPLTAQEIGIQGKVFVSFVIDETGNILDVTLARGVDDSLDKEALRVVRSMPQWKPGRQGDKNVKVRYTVPINFRLQ